MTKVMKIEMNKDKTISVLNQGEKKIVIKERKITAKMIYDSLDYQMGDSYKVESKNKHDKDGDVLDALVNLYKEITASINSIII